MTYSFISYEQHQKSMFHDCIEAFWNNNGTLLIVADKEDSINFNPKELEQIIERKPNERVLRELVGLFPRKEFLNVVIHLDETIEVWSELICTDGRLIPQKSIRLKISEWQTILEDSLAVGRKYLEDNGIAPLMGTDCLDETTEGESQIREDINREVFEAVGLPRP